MVLQLAVQSELGSRLQGVRHWYVQPIQETNERSLALEYSAVHGRRRIQGLVQNQIRDLSLFVAEKLT